MHGLWCFVVRYCISAIFFHHLFLCGCGTCSCCCSCSHMDFNLILTSGTDKLWMILLYLASICETDCTSTKSFSWKFAKIPLNKHHFCRAYTDTVCITHRIYGPTNNNKKATENSTWSKTTDKYVDLNPVFGYGVRCDMLKTLCRFAVIMIAWSF